MSSSLYSALPDTTETSFAREMTDMMSEVPEALLGAVEVSAFM